MNKFFSKISPENAEIDFYYEKRSIFLTRIYTTIILLLSCLLIIDIIEKHDNIIISSLRLVGIVVAFILLKKRYFFPSIYLSLLVGFLSTIIGAFTMEEYNTFNLVMFPLCATLFYVNKNMIINIGFVIIACISMVLMLYYQVMYQTPAFNIGTVFSTIVIFTIFFLILVFYSFEFRLSENEIQKKNNNLESQNKALEQKNKELEESNEFITKLLSVIAHDLRNPFNNIVGFSNLLYNKIGTVDQDKQTQYIEQIVTASQTGYHILENLLSWAKSESHTIELNLLEVRSNALLDSVISEFEIPLKSKGLALDRSTDIDFEFETDYTLISTILRNLLSNAIKFSPQNGTISIQSKIDNYNRLSFILSNEGAPIAEVDKNNILNRKWEFSSEGTNGEKGTGLGMAICFDFAERLKASLKIQNDGKNSFILTLPSSYMNDELTVKKELVTSKQP